ncbi:acyl carrier protein [Streptococcus thermophilus]|jgi:acyl carrier protein|nr:acyl carrier protein [Streptococcus thermophilus]MCE2064478.1 acyl carrier protein [Streptococcus thermophilus]MCE2066239.1 acyl carrier protein [Streptococcus thermophilus]MCE2072988.1 acyl carrier protein [Streptococcus thermophilus]MCE2077901.1 acyl carrier protein [Streptococcus thermophilus]
MRKITRNKFIKNIQKLTVVPIITGDENLIEDLYIDSLSLVSLIVNLEKKYEIELYDDLLIEAGNSLTANELFKLINVKRSEGI